MIEILQPVWQQSRETHACIRKLLEDANDQQLQWKPDPEMWSIADIVQHVARGNVVYAMIMEGNEPARRPPLERPTRAELLERLNSSEAFVKDVFERIPLVALTTTRADDWCPLGVDVEGPLDGLWFALQIVRHTAYHAGQISYILQIPPGQ